VERGEYLVDMGNGRRCNLDPARCLGVRRAGPECITRYHQAPGSLLGQLLQAIGEVLDTLRGETQLRLQNLDIVAPHLHFNVGGMTVPAFSDIQDGPVTGVSPIGGSAGSLVSHGSIIYYQDIHPRPLTYEAD
jgi:hypothetical protein